MDNIHSLRFVDEGKCFVVCQFVFFSNTQVSEAEALLKWSQPVYINMFWALNISHSQAHLNGYLRHDLMETIQDLSPNSSP